jgi:hypothetical protein
VLLLDDLHKWVERIYNIYSFKTSWKITIMSPYSDFSICFTGEPEDGLI